MKKQIYYIQLAQQLISDIEQQIYPPNKPLPSLRSFMDIQQVSMTTALACYRYGES
jgi:DNA-binding transcriptional regulator YhcF (GntR family)